MNKHHQHSDDAPRQQRQRCGGGPPVSDHPEPVLVSRDGAEIEAALECGQCVNVLESHLEHCEVDDCGVVETYWRVRGRIEAGDWDDWRSLARSAMVVMMTAESWMHECHDHRVEHDDEEWELDATGDQRVLQRRARERLGRLKRGCGTASVVVESPPAKRWVTDGPQDLRELHNELTALEILRRAEHLASLRWPADTPEWDAVNDHGVEERQAARVLVWAASEWLGVDDLLDVVVFAARRVGWADLSAYELFSELLPRPRPG